ncbi:hypothetical protein CPB97_008560 [Podila verticillata]|nr:hypothetical protein CPB97_008560 [Podila verticillata]
MAPALDQIILSSTEKDNGLSDRNTFATRVAGKGADPEKKALLANDDFDLKEHVKFGSRWGPLHVHPLVPHTTENPEVIVLDSRLSPAGRYNTNNSWHSDVSFEPYPSSFSILKFDEIPEGGDTVWSDGYQLYDSLSPSIQAFLEGLTATHTSDIFRVFQANTGRKTFGKLNDSSHPVVRTNPVTGWKSIFTNSVFTREIDNVTPAESKWILEYLNDVISKRLDYQVRFRWEKDSVAIWDNRSSFHTGVPDFKPYFRRGLRVTVSGEKPYFDKETSSTQAKAFEKVAEVIVAEQEAAEKAKQEALEKASATTA